MASSSTGNTTKPAPPRVERVQVYCRLRPLLQREREGWSYDQYTEQYGEDADGTPQGPPPVATREPEQGDGSCFLTEKGPIPLNSSVLRLDADAKTLTHLGYNTVERKDFLFDASLAEDTRQSAVYERVARGIVRDVLDGYNGTVLAYGQTSTGKTYTMLGKDDSVTGEHRGVIPRAFEDIFNHARASRDQAKTTVALSYVQVYCERVFDLLNPEASHASLVIREDPERGGVYLDGAATIAVSSVEECMQLIARGNGNRAVATTGMNAHSSRSHAVLIARIERKEAPSPAMDGAGPPTRLVKMSTLFLVDLAGSERVKKAKVYGRHVNELKAINLSLSALGNCIAALSKQQPQRHVPYRDSKLTRLLSASLGGNAKTALLLTVSPSPTEAGETLSTLLFGQRAMRVTVQAHQNVLSVLDYKALYEETQQRLDELRASTQQLEAEAAAQSIAQRAAQDQLLKAQLRIQHLEFECQATKMHHTNSGDDSSGSRIDEAQLAQLVKQHTQDMAAIQLRCDTQVTTYRRLAEEAQSEWHELEDQLAAEKQQVLACLQDLKEFKHRFFELEDTTTDRIAELVADDGDKDKERRYERELMSQKLAAQDKTIAELQHKLAVAAQREQQLQEQMEIDFVPKDTIKQMETLYEGAISRLQDRVGSLEKRSGSSRKLTGNQESDIATKAPLPAVVPPPAGKAVPKIGRILPASKANALR